MHDNILTRKRKDIMCIAYDNVKDRPVGNRALLTYGVTQYYPYLHTSVSNSRFSISTDMYPRYHIGF